MNERIKNIYRSKLLEYIKKENPNQKGVGKNLIKCCLKCSEEPTAQINNNKITCYTPTCKHESDIFDYIRKTKKQFKDDTDDQIAEYLQHLLKIEILDDTDELLKKYEGLGFCLIPIAPESKRPTIKWKEKYYKDPKIWRDWLDRGWGLGLRLGEESGVDAIDIDSAETFEKVKHLMGETMIQDTSRGYHFLYKYNPEIKKTLNRVFRDDGYELEYRTEGAYVVIAPTSVNGEKRVWNKEKIQTMPKELNEFVLKYYNKGHKEQTADQEIQESITNNDLSKVNLTGLDGCCNDTFIRYGGVLRKKCNSEQIKWALKHLNNMLSSPMDNKTLYGLINQVDKYQHYDKTELAKTVLDRLDIIGEGTAYQIAGSLKHDIKDVEDVLKHLDNENKVINVGNRKFKILNDIEWTTETNDLGIPIDFNIPYFSKHARFDFGNMIIVGASSGVGKTHIAANLVKGFVDQGIMPYVLNTEAGSKIGKITDLLKVPKNSYYVPQKIPIHPTDIELKDNAVTVLDWLTPKDGNFAEMGNTLEYFHNQMKKHSGLIIVLMQLRTSNNEWYAKDLVFWYGAMVVKYLFGDGGNDSQNTYFKTEKIRDSRDGQQYKDIPMYFNKDNRLLEER